MIEKFSLEIPQFNQTRTIHVYLPDDYHSTDLKYPVLYMFDGHNLFSDEDATYGRSWRMGDHMRRYSDQCIIVGQECSHEGHRRLSEYAPFTFQDKRFGIFRGLGQETMEFFTKTLKPYIDKKYRTKKGRKDTWIGGSSCGGIMAFYAGIAYSSVYSKAICASPYFVPSIDKMLKLVSETAMDKKSRFYLSWGALEGGSHEFVKETKACCQLANLLQMKGKTVYCNVKENGGHTEKDWEDELPLMLDFLFENGPFNQD
ncbi:MAG: alpha/beta hydrolase [Erysipelotrichaceae bacterium]|nr:alpha/beta hydrolase [Erysipelotrichaceae bacterium]